MFKEPAEFHPCLTNERIDHIGHLIERVRAENLDSVDDRDNGWSIGCRAYAWICSEIMMESEKLSWLDIVDSSLKFIGKIGNVEFSFYKGEAEKPKKNIFSRAQTYPELKQYSLFSDIPVPEKLVWVYAVETDLEGMTTNIEFLGITQSGNVVSSRTIPLFGTYNKIADISVVESESAYLPPAPISLPELREKQPSEDK